MHVENELAERLARHPEVKFVLLFASRAGDRARPDSDWDVAVYLDEVLSPRAAFQARLQMLGEMEDLGDLDLVILNEAPPLLGHRALQGKRLLVQDPQAYLRFFQRTLAASEDERHWREIHDRARAARLREGSFGRP